MRRVPVFEIRAVDTLAAGDALHGGFALALAEGRSEAEALRFGAAVAGLKCSRLGGSGGDADAGRGRGACWRHQPWPITAPAQRPFEIAPCIGIFFYVNSYSHQWNILE